MADQKKRFTIVLESEGQEKVTAQIAAMTNAAKSMGASLDTSFSAFNEKTNKLRTTFQLTVDQALKLEQAISKVQSALQKGGLSQGFQQVGDTFKVKSDLSRISEGKAPAAKSSMYTDEWKLANAERAAAAKQRAAEEAAEQKRIEIAARESARRQAADYLAFWKQALREKEIAEQQAAAKHQAAFTNSVRAQQTAMSQQLSVGKASAFYGEGSQQTAQAKAAIQEAQIRANLASEIKKIEEKYSAGKFGIRAADNRINAAFSTAQKELNALNVSLAQHKRGLEEAGKTQSSFAARVLESISIYRVFNAALNTVGSALRSVPQVGIQLEQTTATLTAVFGSFGQAANQIAFLNAEADRTGLKLADLRRSYATFSASALLAGQSAASVQKIFADVNTTATTLHLTTDQVNGVFLALSQMFNKGKVQAEELTKQLAQTLPGITNQAAKALGMSAAQLGEEMKKGLVSADQAVQLMMARMADAFGGEAFKRASSNLNAELGRLSTSWTHLAENVYKATEGTMTATVRWATSLIDSMAGITNNTYETERAIRQLSTGGVILATGALGTMAGKALLASKAVAELRAGTLAFSAVAARFAPTAILIGLAAIAAKALDAKWAMDDASAAAKRLMREKEAIARGPEATIEFKINEDASVQALNGQIKSLERKIIRKKAAPFGTGWLMGEGSKEEINKEIDVLAQELQKRKDTLRREMAEEKKGEQFKYTPLAADDKITKLQLQNAADKLKREGKDREAAILTAKAGFAEELKLLNDEKARIDKVLYDTAGVSYGDYQQALKDSATVDQQIQEIQTRTTTAGDKLKTNSGGVSKQLRTDMSGISEMIQEQQNKIAGSLDALEGNFTSNLISIKQYYTERRRLGSEDIALQQQEVQEQISLTKSAGDSARAASLEVKYKELVGKGSRENEKLIRAEAEAYRTLADVIADVNTEYLQMQGKGSGAATAAFEQKYKQIKQQLLAEKDQGPLSAVASNALSQIEQLGSYARATDAAEESNNKYIKAKEQLAAKEERIQNNLRTGADSEIEALYKTQKARKEAIASMEEYVAAQEKALSGQPEDSPEVKRLRQVRQELEKLSEDSNMFTARFSNIFSQGVTAGLTEFTSKTGNAKEAFGAFASSVIKNLADMATQAASSAFTNMMSKGMSSLFGGTALGGMFGLADGGATTGLSRVSGTVLTQPTFFPGANVIPFAKGGVLAGEAGHEAVIPLKNGKIGVDLKGGGQGSGNVYNISVSVQSAKGESSEETGNKVAAATMRAIAREEIADAKRTGNSLNRPTAFRG